MIKKTLILIIGFYSLAICLNIFQSCGLLEYDSYICNVSFSNVYQETYTDTAHADFGMIEFELIGNDNCQSAFNNFELDLIQSCYATTKKVNWQNSIEKESIQLLFDKQIIIENDTILAGENILANEVINKGTDILIENYAQAKLIIITVAGETGRLIEFNKVPYEIIFKCSTSDNRELEDIYEYVFNE